MNVARLFLIVLLSAVPGFAHAAEADYHHVHLNVTNGDVAAQWYIAHMGCEAIAARTDAARCGSVQLLFINRPPRGGNEGTAIDHFSFSVPDLNATIKGFIKIGVGGTGIRVMDRESPIRELPGLFKVAYVKDPWGTKIEVVEDAEHLGFHHVHLFSANPSAALTWYQSTLGGKPAKLKGQIDGLMYGTTWLVITSQPEPGPLQPTEGRTIDHLGFALSNLDAAATELQKKGVQLRRDQSAGAKVAMISGPDNVLIEATQP